MTEVQVHAHKCFRRLTEPLHKRLWQTTEAIRLPKTENNIGVPKAPQKSYPCREP